MSARCHGKEIPLYSKWILFKRNHAFECSSALLVSSGPHLVGAFGWSRRRLFFLFPSLCFRNDPSQGMIHGYVMDGFVLLCFSIFYSFTAILSALFLNFHHPPYFSQICCLCPCMSKGGKKSHSFGAEFHFLTHTYCFLWFFFFFMMWLQCDIIF